MKVIDDRVFLRRDLIQHQHPIERRAVHIPEPHRTDTALDLEAVSLG